MDSTLLENREPRPFVHVSDVPAAMLFAEPGALEGIAMGGRRVQWSTELDARYASDPRVFPQAGVAKLADARDLKSRASQEA
jgi:hypothetical protein